jgi:drug/metabolite transporter (DMT)-like permease
VIKIRKTIVGAIAISVSAILWGLDGVVLTPNLFSLDVGFVVFMLHLIPFLIMNTFLYKEYKHLKKFTRQDYIDFGLVALLGGALGTLAIVKALFLVNFDHLSIVVLLQKLQPVFAIILAAIILKEKIKPNFVEWALVAIIASYFLTFGISLPNVQTNEVTIKASLWALVAAASFGSATVFGKKVLLKYSFHTSTFYRFGFTTLIMLIFVAITNKFAQFSSVTQAQWITFLIIAFTTGSAAIFLYYYGLTRVKAIISIICELFFPISAIVFDYIFNQSVLSLVQWISAAVMIGAIVRISTLKDSAK